MGTTGVPGESDFGPVELRQHGKYITDVSEDGRAHARHLTQIPIDAYFDRGWIDGREYEAGKKLYRLWYFGGVKLRYVQSSFNFLPSGGSHNYETGIVMDDAYCKALEAIRAGKRGVDMAYAVVCMGHWALHINVGVGINRRMKVLREALDDLADHFGIQREPGKRR